MSWFGVPVDLLERLEREGLSRDDRLLVIEAFAYCSQFNTDGFVTARLPRLSDHPDADAAADRLVKAGIFKLAAGGYFIDAYSESNLSKDEIDKRKANFRQRTERSRRHLAGDHSLCLKGRYCPQGQLQRVTRDTTVMSRATLPTSPYLPDLQGKVGKETADSAEATSAASEPWFGDLEHAYVDNPDNVDRCQHCGYAISNRRHQKALPPILHEIAQVVAVIGPLEATHVEAESDYWRADVLNRELQTALRVVTIEDAFEWDGIARVTARIPNELQPRLIEQLPQAGTKQGIVHLLATQYEPVPISDVETLITILLEVQEAA